MLKEYIDQLYLDNQTQLDKLEKQMKSLIDDLTYAEQWAESLQKENNEQKNIFSPRSMNYDLNEKLESNQAKIVKIKQQMEYTRELIETHMKKKSEYQMLLLEIEDEAENKKLSSESTNHHNNEQFDIEEMKQILNEIYKKTELCLVMLNSNKNGCKLELNNIKKIIKEYANKVK